MLNDDRQIVTYLGEDEWVLARTVEQNFTDVNKNFFLNKLSTEQYFGGGWMRGSY
jgi:hypothetical protein